MTFWLFFFEFLTFSLTFDFFIGFLTFFLPFFDFFKMRTRFFQAIYPSIWSMVALTCSSKSFNWIHTGVFISQTTVKMVTHSEQMTTCSSRVLLYNVLFRELQNEITKNIELRVTKYRVEIIEFLIKIESQFNCSLCTGHHFSSFKQNIEWNIRVTRRQLNLFLYCDHECRV